MLQNPKQITELDGVCHGFAVFGDGQKTELQIRIDRSRNVLAKQELRVVL